MLTVFSSQLQRVVEDATARLAELSTAKDPEASAAKALKKWTQRASGAKLPASLLEKVAALEATIGDESTTVADLGPTGHLNGLSYVKRAGSSFIGHDDGKFENVSCYFSGRLAAQSLGSRASCDLPRPAAASGDSPVRRHVSSTGDEQLPWHADIKAVGADLAEAGCHVVMDTYNKTILSHSVGFHFSPQDFSQSGSFEQAIDRLKGPFAFVLYDRLRLRIVAARDPNGVEPLFWATSEDGLRLYFATDKATLLHEHAEERIKPFPAGGVFISKAGQLEGTLDGKTFTDIRHIWMPKPARTVDPKCHGSVAGPTPTVPLKSH